MNFARDSRVIPAQAGIQTEVSKQEGTHQLKTYWIPACAGMTVEVPREFLRKP